MIYKYFGHKCCTLRGVLRGAGFYFKEETNGKKEKNLQ